MKQFIIAIALLLGLQFSYGQSDKVIEAFGKSYTYEANKEYKKAIAAVEAVYDAGSYEMNLRMGWLYYLAGDHGKSAKYYEDAIAKKPYGIEAKLGYAYPASELGEWNKIRKYYKEILEVDPQNTVVNYRMGLMFYYAAEYAKAKAYFEKVLNLYPFDHDSMLMLAWTNLQMGDTAKAKVLFRKVLLYNPSDESAKEGLSLIK